MASPDDLRRTESEILSVTTTNNPDVTSLFGDLSIESEIPSVTTTNNPDVTSVDFAIGSERKPDVNSLFDAAAAHIGLDGSLASAEALCDVYGRIPAIILYGLYQRAKAGRCDHIKQTAKTSFEFSLNHSWLSFRNMASASARQLFLRSLKVLGLLAPNLHLTIQGLTVEPITNVETHVLDPNLHLTIQGSTVEPITNVETHKRELECMIDPATQDLFGIAEAKPISRETGCRMESQEKIINLRGLGSICIYDSWFTPTMHGRLPKPRTEHGSVTVQNKMYVFGGKHLGGYLNDLQVLDFTSLTWSKVKARAVTSPTESLNSVQVTPCAGHSLITWNNRILSIAGLAKVVSDTISVKEFDINESTWRNLETFGTKPISRRGQSVTLIGSMLVMFGGEDAKGSRLNDLNILDLDNMSWVVCDNLCSSPSPRSHHTAACHANQYVLIFGGETPSTVYSDLYIFDLQKREWSRPEQRGVAPGPRARHAGVTIRDNWFIVGGRDHKNGVSETLVLNMSTLVWSVVTNVGRHSPLANEGLSLVSGMYNGEEFLVSFGGFNRLCSNKINVLRPSYKNYAQDRLIETPRSCIIVPKLRRTYASSEDELLSEAQIDRWMWVLWEYRPQLSNCKSEISKGAEASCEPNKEPELDETECSNSDHRMPYLSALEFQEKFGKTKDEFYKLPKSKRNELKRAVFFS